MNTIKVTVEDTAKWKTVFTGHHEVQGFVIDDITVYDPKGRDDITDAVEEAIDRADAISALSWTAAAFVDTRGDEIRPDVVRALATAFVEAANTCVTEEEEDFMPFQRIDPLILAHVLMQIVGEYDPSGEGVTLNRAGKLAAIECGQVLGPDWAQVLYRFAVLATRNT